MRIPSTLSLLTLAVAFPNIPTSVHAGVLFSEGFDGAATANIIQLLGDDAELTFVDYSEFLVDDLDHSLPEAPNQVEGTAATKGILGRVNLDGTPSGINIFAADAPGGSGVSFSGNYTLSYDMYMGISPDATRASSGTTEIGIWGVGVDGSVNIGRISRADDALVGTWGWISTEGGFGSEDAAFRVGNSDEPTLLNDTADADLFFEAFPDNEPITPAPNNAWTEVTVTVLDGNVSVAYNGIEFFSEESTQTEGFAVIGYEDPFGSISEFPEYQWGLFDNFVVEEILPPEGPEILDLVRNADSGDTTVSWKSQADAVYTLEVSSDLQEWGEVADGIDSAGEVTTFTEEDISPDVRARYYRVRDEG